LELPERLVKEGEKNLRKEVTVETEYKNLHGFIGSTKHLRKK
jgi:hypothetical protein